MLPPIRALPQDADEVTVRSAFKRLALLHHPDKNSGCEEAAERFKRVGEAYGR